MSKVERLEKELEKAQSVEKIRGMKKDAKLDLQQRKEIEEMKRENQKILSDLEVEAKFYASVGKLIRDTKKRLKSNTYRRADEEGDDENHLLDYFGYHKECLDQAVPGIKDFKNQILAELRELKKGRAIS